jgi:hypothetical protein
MADMSEAALYIAEAISEYHVEPGRGRLLDEILVYSIVVF